MTEPRHDPEKQELRNFGLIFGSLVIAIFGLVIPWFTGNLWQSEWPFLIGSAVLLIALARPAGLALLYRGWMKFGEIAGWINTRVILLLMFYLLLTPVGLIMKVLGFDSMQRKLKPGATSYLVKSKVYEKHHMERPY